MPSTPTVKLKSALPAKTRSPNYQERYLWIPLEVNAGLGDGNNYVGNVDLDPEVSHQVELGWEWRDDSRYLKARSYYRSIDDFIQGTPSADMLTVAVSGNANGDPNPLQFSNVDAEIYGAELSAGYRLTEHWQLDASVEYSRGKRRDISDDLYRIAPLNGSLALTYLEDNWQLTAETLAFARQSKISATITDNSAFGSSASTPGYGLVNLYGEYRLASQGVTLNAGIANLFDKDYVDHLTGFNRVAGGDVAVGDRLPGAGRNLYIGVTVAW